MAEDTENLTIRLLQEMRGEIREIRAELGDLRDGVADLKLRIDGNTVLLTLLGGMVHDHDQRIVTLEGRAKP